MQGGSWLVDTFLGFRMPIGEPNRINALPPESSTLGSDLMSNVGVVLRWTGSTPPGVPESIPIGPLGLSTDSLKNLPMIILYNDGKPSPT
jgi:hypothetical protein